jgi:hypothetical protein
MIALILMIAAAGFLCWLILTLVPLPEPFPKILVAVVCVCLLLYLLQAFGVSTGFPRMRLK